jgi:hypothetical protein
MIIGKRLKENNMAKRPVFISEMNSNCMVKEETIEFEWFPGFSIKQKQNSIRSLHKNLLNKNPKLKALEVSSKSDNELGVALSAFNLMIETKNKSTFSVETAFQASKVFELGGPYLDLYSKTSREAKKDPRIKNSGKLLYFQFFNNTFELEPKTLFYDWLYINALSMNTDLSRQVLDYDAFTDIEFNPQKSINCQARSVALYVSLYKLELLDVTLSSVERFKDVINGSTSLDIGLEIEVQKSQKTQQLSIFDENIDI